MKPFGIWLEEKTQDTQEALLTIWGLTKDDLELPLETLDSQEMLSQLKSLGLWNNLSGDTQSLLTTIINRKLGNVAELIQKIIDLSDLNTTFSSVQPPIK